MATRVFRSNPGEQMEQGSGGAGGVTEAVGAATTKLVEITVDLNLTGVGGTRQITRDEVLTCIEQIESYILNNELWPPA